MAQDRWLKVADRGECASDAAAPPQALPIRLAWLHRNNPDFR